MRLAAARAETSIAGLAWGLSLLLGLAREKMREATGLLGGDAEAEAWDRVR